MSMDLLSATKTDHDKQLQNAFDLIKDAFNKRTSSLSSEVNQWKQVASNQKQQIVHLENQIRGLQSKMAELESALATQHAEKNAILASKNMLADKYNSIRKVAVQLEHFRKSIVSMVTVSPAEIGNLTLNEIEQSYIDESLTSPKKHIPISGFSTSSSNLMPDLSTRKSPNMEQGRKMNLNTAVDNGFLPESLLKHSGLTGDVSGIAMSSRIEDEESSYMVNREVNADMTYDSFMDKSSLVDSAHPSKSDKDPSPGAPLSLRTEWERMQDTTAVSNGLRAGSISSSVNRQTDSDVNSRQRSSERRKSPSPMRKKVDRSPSPSVSNHPRAASSPRNSVQRKPSQSPNRPRGAAGGVNAGTESSNISTVDAPRVYRQIRDVLSPEEFEKFARIIAAFNANTTTADETITAIEKLLSQHRALFIQMKTLVYRALAESAGSNGTSE